MSRPRAAPPAGGPTPGGVGIGLRQPHYRHFRGAAWPGTDGPSAPRAGPDFVEVHSENFFADGGAALAVLQGVRERMDVSLHGVGLSLGSAVGIDPWHLGRLARLVQRIDPVRVSDHACFARALQPRPAAGTAGPAATARASEEALHGADLLPIAFTDAQLRILCANVQRVQERLRRPLLVENLSAYLSFDDEEAWPEADFLAELARRTGCGLLLDLNNLVVNALNDAHPASRPNPDGEVPDPVAVACAFFDALPPAAVAEIHLAGHRRDGHLVIDDHGSRIDASVWQVYRHALSRLGAVPTLIEWDTELPPIELLLEEAARAAQWQRECAGGALPAEAVARWGWPPEPRPPAGQRPPAAPPDGGDGARPPGLDAIGAGFEDRRQRALLETLHLDAEPAPAACLRERGERLARGLGAYRAHAAASSARALRTAYPTVAAMVGEEALASLARALWRASPPRRGDLAQWGLDLPEFIESCRDLDPWPYLADAARLDAAVVRCECAADVAPEPASLELLAMHDPARLRLRLLPCVQLVSSRWPVATLHAAHRGLRERVVDDGRCEPAPSRLDRGADDGTLAPAREALVAGRGESVAVARAGWSAHVRVIGAADLDWMLALQQRLPLDAALRRAGGGFNFEAWLRLAVVAGWLQRAEFLDGDVGTGA